MKLARDEAMTRLATHDHGVLCTLHTDRGVDAVPVAFAVEGELVGVPVDLVKQKSSLRLQRERNLEADPRATLLVEHWDADDWSLLWWVRAELQWQPDADGESLAGELATKYPQYRDRPFAKVLAFTIVEVSGWAASA